MMVYSLTYQMLTGGASRQGGSAKDTALAYTELALAGAGHIIIRDATGTVISLAQLLTIAVRGERPASRS